MFQLIIVVIVVLAAGVYVGNKLLRQMKGHGCDGCDCVSKAEKSPQLVQVTLSKPSVDGSKSAVNDRKDPSR